MYMVDPLNMANVRTPCTCKTPRHKADRFEVNSCAKGTCLNFRWPSSCLLGSCIFLCPDIVSPPLLFAFWCLSSRSVLGLKLLRCFVLGIFEGLQRLLSLIRCNKFVI